MSLKNFLTSLRAHVDKNLREFSSLNVVTGNQSADLDSVISSLSYAYFNYVKNKSFLIPLINVSRDRFKLRRDIETLLEIYSINASHLYFADDLKYMIREDQKINLVLVDHCNIQGDVLKHLFGENKVDVKAIIDHHEDEKCFLDASPRIIKPCGSCSSLVYKYWSKQLDEKELNDKNSEVVPILLAPLLIDTSYLSSKVEEDDKKAYESYQKYPLEESQLHNWLSETGSKKLKLESLGHENILDAYYKIIKKAKKDLKGFSFYDILEKDYKFFRFEKNDNSALDVGFSSLSKSFKWITSKYGKKEIFRELQKFVSKQKLDLLVITTSFSKKETDEYTREFAYFFEKRNENSTLFIELSNMLKDTLKLNHDIYHIEKFQWILSDFDENANLILFNQGELSASRKQVVPLVKEAISNIKL
ncbi:Piso0_002576 [Millerozyma farinosa CBS 7064]|uniref:Piso0_002576 protein n=1 Tax=Pichia sorbitophila (strain ATCC MYA-4447 / BCRC 22081 / CBS 7064 / NBRC 10061 / NRRL Y-12695) TaxID=559304 RepID=G8YCZ5_PICSO|nr:Piso0_002576 [Millerozyma farinosa CBS 7064]